MFQRRYWAALFVVLVACAPTKVDELFLTILLPNEGDTVHTSTVPVEGLTSVGASVHIAEMESDTGKPMTVDDTGHFAGSVTIPEEPAYPYAIIFKVRKGSRSLVESRMVYFRP
jgi:hypothetical protein